MALTLEDSVKLTKVEMLEAEVPLDSEQIGWMKQAYQQIEEYVGQEVQIKQIDDALSLVGEAEEIWDQDYLGGQFEGQLLSLRIVNISEGNKEKLAEYEEKKKNAPPGVYPWAPNVGNTRLFLIAENKGSALYFGVGVPILVDGAPSFESERMAKITYEK